MSIFLFLQISSQTDFYPPKRNPDIIVHTNRSISMKKLFIFCSFLTFLFTTFFSCNSVEPPAGLTIKLKLEDVSCTEAWIELTSTNLTLPTNVTLYKNDVVGQNIILSHADTLLYIDSLFPNQTYLFQSVIQPINQSKVKSNQLSVTTMDTTSHNFTWQTWTFGEHSSSVLYDVAIIDENNIWAVGEIYMNDSLAQPDPNAYNAVHWDGSEWTLHRIMFYTVCGQQSLSSYTAKSILAFNENDIWIAMDGDQITRLENEVQTNTICLPWSFVINKIWGSSSNDLYVVGNNGNIARYYNGTWSRIESGTDVDLKDVWGSPDGTVWACGYNSSYSLTVLIKLDNNIINKLYEGSPNNKNNNLYIGPLSGGWTNSKFFTYLLNWGALYKQDNKDELDLSTLSQPFFYDVAFCICANDKNDIIVSGESGMFGHFNGVRFYDLPDLRRGNIQYLGNDIKDNFFIVVGWDYSTILTKAIVTIGRR